MEGWGIEPEPEAEGNKRGAGSLWPLGHLI